jgi:hypothetical protein
MFDFLITFLTSNTFTFTDNSDYSGLTVTETSLLMYKPPITVGVNTPVPLFPAPLSVLGDPITVDTSLLGSPTTLPDGVYQFDYLVTSDENGLETTTDYFIKDLGLLSCRTSLIKNLISGNGCKSCEANSFDAILNAAHYEADADNFTEAETLTNHLIKTCTECNNC